MRVGLLIFLMLVSGGCALFETRPTQEMSDTEAALRAAQSVQADVLAPELYRQANEWFIKAKKEYAIKNFRETRDYANRAKYFAERSEFEALLNGAKRSATHTEQNQTTPETPQEEAPSP